LPTKLRFRFAKINLYFIDRNSSVHKTLTSSVYVFSANSVKLIFFGSQIEIDNYMTLNVMTIWFAFLWLKAESCVPVLHYLKSYSHARKDEAQYSYQIYRSKSQRQNNNQGKHI